MSFAFDDRVLFVVVVALAAVLGATSLHARLGRATPTTKPKPAAPVVPSCPGDPWCPGATWHVVLPSGVEVGSLTVPVAYASGGGRPMTP